MSSLQIDVPSIQPLMAAFVLFGREELRDASIIAVAMATLRVSTLDHAQHGNKLKPHEHLQTIATPQTTNTTIATIPSHHCYHTNLKRFPDALVSVRRD
jgi:hypothetical protein